MSDIFVAMRRIASLNGQAILIPIAFTSTKAEAQQVIDEQTMAIQAMAPAQLVAVDPNGGGHSIGFTAGQFLLSLGIRAVTYEILEAKTHSAVVVPDAPRIVLARN